MCFGALIMNFTRNNCRGFGGELVGRAGFIARLEAKLLKRNKVAGLVGLLDGELAS